MYHVDQLKPGDILLMTHRAGSPWWDALLDAAIAWSTASPWVHAALVGEGVLINPLWHVVKMPLETYMTNGTIFRAMDSTPQQRRNAVHWAVAHFGQAYGVKELLSDAARFDLHWIPRWRHHLQYFTCSGFVAQAYLEAGYPLTLAPFPAPSDLAASPRLTPLLAGENTHP